MRFILLCLLVGQTSGFGLSPLPTYNPSRLVGQSQGRLESGISVFSAGKASGVRTAAQHRAHTGVSLFSVRMQSEGKKKVVIIGAGPAGLLSAHFLLKRGKYDVTIAEMRNDPREGTAPSRRSYSLGLGVRGRQAIKGLGEDLWEAVKKRGVMSERFCLHLGKKVLDIRQKSTSLLKTEPSCLINRADLCCALLDQLDHTHFGSSLKTHFGAACEGVDFNSRSVTLAGVGQVSYDLLIAADGVNSAVREAVLKKDSSIKYASAPLNGSQKILHQKMPAGLDPNAVHAMSGSVELADKTKERVGFFWVPERNSTTGEQQACILVNWEEGSSCPKSLLAMTEAEEVQGYLNKAFPNLEGGITLDAAVQLLEQRPSINTVNKLSCYSYSDGKVIMMGDAAHSSGGASGQGCNSALQDAQVLNTILGEVQDDIDKAVALFSERRVKEGHALLDLSINQSPRAPLLRVLFLLISAAETFGHRLLPNVIMPPTQNMLTQTDLPFSEIYDKKKMINDFIKTSNMQYGVFTGYD